MNLRVGFVQIAPLDGVEDVSVIRKSSIWRVQVLVTLADTKIRDQYKNMFKDACS